MITYNHTPLFLYKSCHSKDHLKISKTLKIGTLEEYRESEDIQISDLHEGTYSINLNLQNIHAPLDFFNYLLNGANGEVKLVGEFKSKDKKSFISPHLAFIESIKSNFSWTHSNRFIFCFSGLDNLNDSKGMFDDYNDGWFIKRNDFKESLQLIADEFLIDVKKRLKKGEKIFYEDAPSINELRLKFKLEKVIYRERITDYDSRKFYLEPEFLYFIHDKIPYTKPLNYSKEKEYRLIMDFYNQNGILTPKVKHLIINTPKSSHFIFR
ncbi:hypothetical protein ACSVXM_002826 [Enterobacter hormaechei]